MSENTMALDELEQDIRLVGSRLLEIEQRVAELERHLQNLENLMPDIHTVVGDVERMASDFGERVAQLETAIRSMHDDIVYLFKDLDEDAEPLPWGDLD